MRSAGAATIKRASEIERMRAAGTVLAGILEVLRAELRPGVTTGDLDAIAERMIRDAGAVSSFKGYGSNPPFPGVICASINDEVVHGIPSPRRRIAAASNTISRLRPDQRITRAITAASARLADGDVVSIDIGCIVDGWHADCARTWTIGPVPREVRELVDATRRGMEAARTGGPYVIPADPASRSATAARTPPAARTARAWTSPMNPAPTIPDRGRAERDRPRLCWQPPAFHISC